MSTLKDGWAFISDTDKRDEIGKAILDRYHSLIDEYNIIFGNQKYDPMVKGMRDYTEDEINKADIWIILDGGGYAHTDYYIRKNTTDLDNDDLAIICDRGNVCFGYRCSGNFITIYTD